MYTVDVKCAVAPLACLALTACPGTPCQLEPHVYVAGDVAGHDGESCSVVLQADPDAGTALATYECPSANAPGPDGCVVMEGPRATESGRANGRAFVYFHAASDGTNATRDLQAYLGGTAFSVTITCGDTVVVRQQATIDSACPGSSS